MAPARNFRALALVGALLAGCFSAPAAEEDAPVAVADPGAMPSWAVGDWWTYRFASEIYPREVEATIVVGEANADGYLVGMPAEDYALDAILFHLPPVGAVRRDLAWDVHGTVFEAFRWPLADGAAWDAQWISSTAGLSAKSADITVANATERGFRITNEGREEDAFGRAFALEYSPSARALSAYSRTDPDGRVRESLALLDFGRGWTGDLRVISNLTVVAIESRTAAALSGEEPAPPVVPFDADDSFDALLVACVFGGAPGWYAASVASPSRPACLESGFVQPGGLAMRAVANEVANEAGTWSIELAAAGQGSATAEVLGYDVRDASLA